MKWIGSAFLCSAMAFACGGGGGGSGVNEDKLVVELSPAEAADICESIMDASPAFREVTCPDGSSGTVGFETDAEKQAAIDDCIDGIAEGATAAPNCPVTAGEFEDCFVAFANQSDAELCDPQALPAECEELFTSPECNPQ